MFGIGFSELIVIGLVVVIFIKPEDLPAFFRAAGRLYAKAKKAYDEVVTIKDEFVKVVNDTVSEIEVSEPAPSPDRPADPGLAVSDSAIPVTSAAAAAAAAPPGAASAEAPEGSGAAALPAGQTTVPDFMIPEPAESLIAGPGTRPSGPIPRGKS